MEIKNKKDCGTKGWGINKKSPTKKKFPPIWPGVYVWLLVGVFILISQFFM